MIQQSPWGILVAIAHPRTRNFNSLHFPLKFKSPKVSLIYITNTHLNSISMANFEVPSFSLGLDDTPPHSPIHPPLSPDLHVSDSDSDSDPESRPDPPRPLLKRLRRGPPPPCLDPDADADDDIEDFSSQEDPDQGQVSLHFKYFTSFSLSLLLNFK